MGKIQTIFDYTIFQSGAERERGEGVKRGELNFTTVCCVQIAITDRGFVIGGTPR